MKKKSKKTEEETSNNYVFFNLINHTMLFVNALNFDEAMNKFDLCAFKFREHWKIFLECGQQPTNAPKGKND